MKKKLFVLLVFKVVFMKAGFAQCFSLDSIPKYHTASIILDPAIGEEGFHKLEIMRVSSDAFMAFYTHPMIFVGGECEAHHGVLIEHELFPLINQLFCSGIKFYPDRKLTRWYKDTGRIPSVLFNQIPDSLSVESDLYRRLEELLFGAYIIQQQNRQSAYLSQVTTSLLGCYKAFGNESITLQSSDIQLTRLNDPPTQTNDLCFWCFVPGLVAMSGPCYGGVDMAYQWELIQDFGELRMCLFSSAEKEPESRRCLYSFYLDKPETNPLELRTRPRYPDCE